MACLASFFLPPPLSLGQTFISSFLAPSFEVFSIFSCMGMGLAESYGAKWKKNGFVLFLAFLQCSFSLFLPWLAERCARWGGLCFISLFFLLSCFKNWLCIKWPFKSCLVVLAKLCVFEWFSLVFVAQLLAGHMIVLGFLQKPTKLLKEAQFKPN